MNVFPLDCKADPPHQVHRHRLDDHFSFRSKKNKTPDWVHGKCGWLYGGYWTCYYYSRSKHPIYHKAAPQPTGHPDWKIFDCVIPAYHTSPASLTSIHSMTGQCESGFFRKGHKIASVSDHHARLAATPGSPSRSYLWDEYQIYLIFGEGTLSHETIYAVLHFQHDMFTTLP